MFWPLVTCQKWLFVMNFLENRPFNCQRIRPQLRNLFQSILRNFLHRKVKTDGVALCFLKSDGHFTISLPVKIFVNRRKNYHFVILFEPNHKSTLVWIEWTFWAYLKFTSCTHIVIITIFHLYGLNAIIEHLRYKKYVFSSLYELWIVI